MKTKFILSIAILTLLSGCRGALISDEPITVQSKHATHRNFYYKNYYKCRQNGLKVRVYSNQEYQKGQIIKLN